MLRFNQWLKENEKFFEQWLRAREKHPDKYVLVFDGTNPSPTVSFHRNESLVYKPVYCNPVVTTRILDELGIPWILVNAPDEVAAACGVPTD